MPMKKLNNQKIDFHFFDQKVLIPPLKGHCALCGPISTFVVFCCIQYQTLQLPNLPACCCINHFGAVILMLLAI